MTDFVTEFVYDDDRAWIETTAAQMARRVCGRRWARCVEDATSEAVIAAWKAARGGKPRAVQAVAARRGALSYLKRLCGEHFQRTSLVETAALDDCEYYQETSSEDEGLAAVDAEAAFESIIAHLDCERSKRMLRMRMRDCLTQEQIGEREGMSQPVVSRVLAEALEQLRAAMEGNPEMRAMYVGGGLHGRVD